MKVHVHKSTTFVTLCFVAVGIALFFGSILFLIRPAQAQVVGGKLITVHDRGDQTSFITTKETLKEALEEQHITIDAKDAVEPSLEEHLVAPDYQVNIYRARPVTVIDGAIREKIVTPYQSAERIAEDAHITLHAEDTTKLERSKDLVGDGAGLQLTIDRATQVSVDLFGKQVVLRTQAETVGALLNEKGIELDSNGRVSTSIDTPISEGLHLRVWQEGSQTITAEEDVAFGVKQIKDADRAVGYKAVQSAGIVGKRTVTYEVHIVNGVETERKEIASVTLTEPVEQVEIIGSKPNYLPYSGGGTKTDWLAASNIPEEMWGYADFMVQKESGWNPNAVNRSSGACGLAQALPCSKLGPNWNNPVVALNWMNNYVNGRYGGWQGAYNFWTKNKWY